MYKAQTINYRVQWLERPRAQPISTQTERLKGRNLQQRNRLLLLSEPLCRQCNALGRVTAAQEVDHIQPLHLGGVDAASNLQPLCKACHYTKTQTESRGRGGRGQSLVG